MTDVRQMHADLVRASRFQPALEQRRTLEALDHRVMRHCRAAVADHGHLRALRRVAPDRGIDGAAGQHPPLGQRPVMASDRAGLKLAHKIGLRRQRLGHHQQAAGVLVETMHDAGTRHFRNLRRVMQQRIEQRPAPVAAAGMHDQPGGLVDHQQVRVLEHDLQRDVLGLLGGDLGQGRSIDFDALAAAHLLARAG